MLLKLSHFALAHNSHAWVARVCYYLVNCFLGCTRMFISLYKTHLLTLFRLLGGASMLALTVRLKESCHKLVFFVRCCMLAFCYFISPYKLIFWFCSSYLDWLMKDLAITKISVFLGCTFRLGSTDLTITLILFVAVWNCLFHVHNNSSGTLFSSSRSGF